MLHKKINNFVGNLSAYFFPGEIQEGEARPMDYYQMVECARREWQDAKRRFDQISDPDLIDHAIYSIEAAEKRYMYLLKKAREESAKDFSPCLEGSKPPRG